MKKILLVILAMTFAAGTAHAGGCEGCDAVKVFGYMAPRFEMVDQGEDAAANMGFGMQYCRFVFTGHVEGGEIVKKVGWRVETDISQPGRQALQWAYMTASFNEQFALRFGHVKMPFSREILHSTPWLYTAERLISGNLVGFGYGGFAYGLEGLFKHEMFKAQFGVYDGQGANMNVENQDPALTLAGRVVVMPPVEGLELGANVSMQMLPQGGSDNGYYADTDNNEYLSNSGMAFGADAQYVAPVGETMKFKGQAEFGMGDNWGAIDEAGDDWSDSSFFSFQYFYVKAVLMVTEEFGFHMGFSSWDPNTDSDSGKNDDTTKLTPGAIYYWAKKLYTQFEVQICTVGGGVDMQGEELDDMDYTNFVLQNVLVWP